MNNDLISRAALTKRFLAEHPHGYKFEAFIEAYKNAPAVDAVEVVRCKDCKHYREGVCENITYIMDGYYRDTFEVKAPDDFCSSGEKMDKEV